ncbi:MAG: HEAT repeat domain-containing protein [Ardenticatenaceae bacterium]|nr:HEAT repeat domain-containing protein [Ardenticatenaceae bacterium]
MHEKSSGDEPDLIITSPRWLKWLIGFCLVMMFVMQLIWVGAFFEEGLMPWIIWSEGILLVISLGTLYLAVSTFQSFTFYDRFFVWRWLGTQIEFPYQAIKSAEHRERLLFETHQKRYSVYFPMRDGQNSLFSALEARVPALISAKKERLNRPLPIFWSPRFSAKATNSFFFLFMGPGFLSLGVWAIYDALTREDSQMIGALIFGVMAIGISALMSWMFLSDFVWSVQFDREHLRVRNFFKAQMFPIALLNKMAVDHEIRTYRGISREAWFLQFEFADGRSFKFEPTENGVANGFAPQSDRKFLTELSTTLRQHYFQAEKNNSKEKNVKEAVANPHRPPADPWGTPQFSKIDPVEIYNFELTTLNYGEQQMGAEKIHFVFNRPIHNINRLQTINGQATFSPDQRYLAIFDPLILTLFDLATDQIYRLRDRTSWEYEAVRFDDQHMHVTMRGRQNWQDRAALQPIPLNGLAETMISQNKPLPGRLLARDQLIMILNHIRHWPDEMLGTEFESLRDLFLGLGLDILPDVLQEANQPRNRRLQELLIMVLADHHYPPAMPHFVEWLDHENEEIRFIAAMSLDHLANGRFAISSMIVKGWVQHDQIAAAVPDIQAWWRAEWANSVPSEAEWRAKKETKRPATDQEKRFNFVELNPQWVMQGDGVVQPPLDGYHLPRNKGMHVVAGQVVLQGEKEARFAAFEIDSHAEDILGIYTRIDGTWRSVKSSAAEWQINVNFS